MTAPTTAEAPDAAQASAGEIRRKVAVGAAFMVLARLAMRLISVVSTLILVRLLVPEDFGLVALAAAAVALAETLTAMSYAIVVVRRPTVERSFYDTAWTLNLLRCLLLGGAVAATAEWQAGLLGDERIALILQIVALGILLDGLMSVGLLRLQREMRFDRIFRFQVVFRLLGFAATIALAWATQSYLCLVLGNVLAKLVMLPYGYWLAPHRPALSLAHWRELLNFSKWSFAANLCVAADGQAANLVIGRFIGIQSVGMFSVSYQIAATPVTELAVPVRGPIYAGYARIAHDRRLLGAEFAQGLGLQTALLLPLSVGIALVAPEAEALALGPAWAGAATIIALCALYAFLDATAHFSGNILMVFARYALNVGVYAMLVAIRLPAIILAAIHAGLVGVAAALLASAALNVLVWLWTAARLLDLRAAALLRETWRSCAAAALMAGVVLGLRWLLFAEPAAELAAHAARLGLLAAAGAGVYVGTLWLLWRLGGSPAGAETQIAAFAQRGLRRLRRRPGHPAQAAQVPSVERPV